MDIRCPPNTLGIPNLHFSQVLYRIIIPQFHGVNFPNSWWSSDYFFNNILSFFFTPKNWEIICNFKKKLKCQFGSFF
jgi:hypothetical protein